MFHLEKVDEGSLCLRQRDMHKMLHIQQDMKLHLYVVCV